jgi:AcrR family transcriptional regulator
MDINTPIPRKPGRPLSFDRQAALQQAMLTFWQHGYETTSISELTAAMGVTAPSIYTAYGDKKQLFLEAMRLYAKQPDDMQSALDRAATARDAASAMLISAAHAFTGETTPRGCLLASATASGSGASADVQKSVADVRRDIIARLKGRIDRDISEGILPETTSAATLAAMVVAVIQGMSVLARDGMDRESLLLMAHCALDGWPGSRIASGRTI